MTAVEAGNLRRDDRPNRAAAFLARARATGRIRLRSAQLALVVAALAAWALSLRQVDLTRIGDMGLITVLPLATLLALALLAAGVVWGAFTGAPDWLMALNLAAFVIGSHALGSILESQPALAVTWLHMGFAEYVATTGQVDPGLDARFSWPGFFEFLAFLKQVAGVDLRRLAISSHGFFALIDLLPLAAIVRSLTRDRTVLWLSLLIFSLANWIGQEYLSPQALAYFFYLSILAVALTWFRRPAGRPGSAGSGPIARSTPVQRGALLGLGCLLIVATVVSHQLTPFMLIASLGALWVVRRLTSTTWILVIGAMSAGWLSYAAWPFVSGHLSELLATLGGLGTNLTSTVANRVSGSPDHQLVVALRLAYTGVLVAFAGGWFLWRWRMGYRELLLAAVGAAPWPLIALNPYGGEMALRAFMFALPAVSFMCAAAAVALLRTFPNWARVAAVLAASFALTAAFILSRYGNERLDIMRPDEVRAVQVMYDAAPRGSVLFAPSGNLPWRYRDVTAYDYQSELVITGTRADLGAVLTILTRGSHPAAFVVLTRSEAAFEELLRGVTARTWAAFESTIAGSGLFDVVYSGPDATVYRLRSRTS